MGAVTDSQGKAVSAGNTKSDAPTPSAQTSDGSVTVAAAVAVNIVDSQADATIPGGLSITAAGPLIVNATNDTGNVANVVFGDTANAWGTDAGTAQVGVGPAVALNLVKDSTEATIGASKIKANGVTVNAGMIGRQFDKLLRRQRDLRSRREQNRRVWGVGDQHRQRYEPGPDRDRRFGRGGRRRC